MNSNKLLHRVVNYSCKYLQQKAVVSLQQNLVMCNLCNKNKVGVFLLTIYILVVY